MPCRCRVSSRANSSCRRAMSAARRRMRPRSTGFQPGQVNASQVASIAGRRHSRWRNARCDGLADRRVDDRNSLAALVVDEAAVDVVDAGGLHRTPCALRAAYPRRSAIAFAPTRMIRSGWTAAAGAAIVVGRLLSGHDRGPLRFPLVTRGKTEESATRRPSTPMTRHSGSTTLSGSDRLPILQVPQG